jgi:hypothetical protein
MADTVYILLEHSLRTTHISDSGFGVCGVWSVNQVLDQHLTIAQGAEED